MNAWRRITQALAIATPLLRPTAVVAGSEDPAIATALFQEARMKADAGNYVEACPLFLRSFQIEPAIGTLLNIGDCQVREGKVATAWASFQKAKELMRGDDDRRAAVLEIIKSLEVRLPKLTIVLSPNSPGTTVIARGGMRLDNAILGLSLPVDPGTWEITATAPLHRIGRYKLSIGEGQRIRLQVEPGPLESIRETGTTTPVLAQPKSTKPTERVLTQRLQPSHLTLVSTKSSVAPRARSGSRSFAYVTLGVGTVSIVGGFVALGLALNEKPVIAVHCDEAKHCDDAGLDAVSRAGTFQWISGSAFALGAAGIGTSLVLFAIEPSPERKWGHLKPEITTTSVGMQYLRRY